MVKLLLVWVMTLMSQWLLAGSPVIGQVIDESNQPIVAAYISINGSSVGTFSGLDGSFSLSSHHDFPWTVKIISQGYITRKEIIYVPGDIGKVILKQGIIPGDVVSLTAARVPENSATTAVQVLSLPGQWLEAIPLNGDPSGYLRNMPGVSLVRNGTESTNIELRGSASVLTTSALVLKDFAPLTAVSDNSLISVASSLSPLDIARIEVVYGPNGALYGTNAGSGVIHFITKDAFRYPGISAMTSVGERSLFSTRVRYADNNSGKWGWKFLANYNQSNDFSIANDQMIGNDGVTSIITGQNFETLGGKRWNDLDNLDDIGLYNWNFEGGLEYRANEKTRIHYTASLSRARTNITSPGAHLLLGLQRFEQQARLELGNLFASIYHRHNFANVDKSGNPNNLADHVFRLNYTAGIEGETQIGYPTRAETYIDLALQYRMHVAEKLEIQFGTDIKLTPAFTNEIQYAAQSGINTYNIFGGFVSGKYKLGRKLQFHAAGRYDYLEAFSEGVFSPRTGLVYNPKPNLGLRLNYSRSVNAPSRQQYWMDYNLSSVLPSFYPATRMQGVAQEVSYHNPVTRFPFGDVAGGELFDLQDIIDAVAAHAGVPSPSVSGTSDPAITTASYAAPMVGFPTGFPITLEQLAAAPLELSKVSQLELAFNHTYRHKLEVNVVLFHLWVDNIPYTGDVVLSAGSQLDLLEISNKLEQQVPEGPQRDALIASLYTVPTNPTEDPAFNGIPGFGVVMSDRAQQFDYVYDLGLPGHGNKNISYYGADLSATYFISPQLSVFANYSYLSQTVWTASDLDETNSRLGYYLNTPPDRINLGIGFYPDTGIYGSVAVNYQSAFESRQGNGNFFSGLNEARSIYDLQLGYRFSMFNNALFDLGLSINNLLDEKYSHFNNLAALRRFSALSLKVSL